jgi:hypothetical protein
MSEMTREQKREALSRRGTAALALLFIGALACSLRAAPRTVLYEHFTAYW